MRFSSLQKEGRRRIPARIEYVGVIVVADPDIVDD
jgi:hypothetical protein